MLELGIMAQPAQIYLANRGIILASMPYPLDSLGNTNIIRLKLVEADRDQDGANVQKPVGSLSKRRMLPDREVVGDA